MRSAFKSTHARDLIGAFFVGAVSLALFLYNNNFKIGFHLDECVKVVEAISGVFYYAHPLFLPVATRFVKLIAGLGDEQSVVQAARTVSAVMAAIGVSGVFFLVRRTANAGIAILASLAIAVTPLLAIHAHYMKEDACLFGFCSLTSICFSNLFVKIDRRAIVLAGIALGFAIASKLVALFLIPVYCLTACLQPEDRKKLLQPMVPMAAIATIVFLLVNLPAFFHLDALWIDQVHQVAQVIIGKPLSVYHPFGFYLSKTLIPDLGIPLCVLALAGLVLLLAKPKELQPFQLFLILYFVIYYLMIELTRYKDWPDYERFPIPLLVPIAYYIAYAAHGAGQWLRRFEKTPLNMLASALPVFIVLASVAPAWDSIRLLENIKTDTRVTLSRLIGDNWRYAAAEQPTTLSGQYVVSVLCYPQIPRLKDARYLVTTSFFDNSIAYGATHGVDKNGHAVAIAAAYQQLLQYPYCEIKPAYRSYAFSNPTLRVFSVLAINNGTRADPATNGRPCDTETLAALPAEEGYQADHPRALLPQSEMDLLCPMQKPLF